jgi:hypothetical protein
MSCVGCAACGDRNGTPGMEHQATTITKYNPEDLRLSKCSWQLAAAKVKAFICGEFSHYRVVKTGKTSEFDDCEKLAIEDGKQTLLQHQCVILRGNSSPNPQLGAFQTCLSPHAFAAHSSSVGNLRQ